MGDKEIPTMSLNLKPHSTEWFAALEKINLHQGAQTRLMIELAGRDDVCSTCGDEESADRKVSSDQVSRGTLDTLRHCDDCAKIRRHMGEIFHPMAN